MVPEKTVHECLSVCVYFCVHVRTCVCVKDERAAYLSVNSLCENRNK